MFKFFPFTIFTIALSFVLCGCTGMVTDPEVGDQPAPTRALVPHVGQSQGPTIFRAGNRYISVVDGEGFCSYNDVSELICQTGVSNPQALPSQALPDAVDRGPCPVKRARNGSGTGRLSPRPCCAANSI